MPLPVVEVPPTTPIYSFAALKSKQREVKERGSREVVHITENGNAAYVFCSEEVFAEEKAQAVRDAFFERELREIIEEGREDAAAGRFVVGSDATIARMREIWGS